MEEVKNCWEYKMCGYEPDGRKCVEFEVCPTPTRIEFDGVNRGRNGGRFCWCVAGTPCKGKRSGGYDVKFFSRCINCPFFQEVQMQEGRHFVLSETNLKNP